MALDWDYAGDMGDLNRATELTTEVGNEIEAMFQYAPWDAEQKARGSAVKEMLVNAFKAIVAFVPPCPDRSAALRKLREVRMDCNSAITHKGKY
jgi:hypothetical protein